MISILNSLLISVIAMIIAIPLRYTIHTIYPTAYSSFVKELKGVDFIEYTMSIFVLTIIMTLVTDFINYCVSKPGDN